MIVYQFLRDLRTQKLRTIVTLFGIMWGTAAVALLLGVGEALRKFSFTAMRGMGENIVIVWPGRTTKAFKGMVKGRGIPLREEDANLLRSRIPQMKFISPEYSRSAKILVSKTPLDAGVSGVYPEWGEMRNMIPDEGGRCINWLDDVRKRRVVFIGNELKEDLFGAMHAVGKYVLIDKIPFLVVGVLKKKIQTSSYTGRDEERAVIPASTFQMMYGHRYLNNIVYSLRNPSDSDIVKKQVYRIMGKKYSFDPEDTDAIGMWDTTMMEKFLSEFFTPFKLFLGVVSALTLVVGGIGVANIMNVIVEERTREIGIKMAVGAKRRTILWNFLNEAFLISGIGGSLGFGFVAAVFKIVSMTALTKYIGEPAVSVSTTLISFGVLTGVAAVSGYFPARRAATLNPVETLR